MDIDARLLDLTREDLPRVQELDTLVWFEVVPGTEPEELVHHLDLRHARALERTGPALPGEPERDRPPLVGVYSAYDLRLTVPAPGDRLRTVPVDGLTWVGVHPDARRQGLLTRMMRDHLHRVHERGEAAVAGLHASEPAIYGRFGYGSASLDVKLVLDRGQELRVPDELGTAADAVETHLVTLPTPEGTAALHEAHLACAATSLGAVTRPDAFAATWYRDVPKARGSKEPRRLLLARRDGALTGYAVLRRESRWEDERSRGEVTVDELGATDHASLLALVRRLVDLDLTTKVTLRGRSVDDPVLWWCGGPRSVGVVAIDSLWLRLVDVPRALAERGYAAPADLVLEVVDELCPWNAGRWRLTVDGSGAATCEPAAGGSAPDVVLPVAALGAAYAGGRTIAAQVPTLGVRELRPGAVRQLSRAMRGDTEPVGAIGF
ncbi:GNAT family N-acetyltransferase [Ornithinimicrobium sp. W1665]|uniref:GNAT family N-acetyltransferase n=1 Tax=Ornithinimicrobium sp. W1665 TaxID=3416666 RepID=UPI003CF2D462